MTRASLLYIASFAAHGALALGVVTLKAAKIRETVAISVVESKKAKTTNEAPPPLPPPAPEAPKSTPKAKAAPRAEAPPPQAEAPAANAGADAPSAPDFGLSLGGTGGGFAVPKAAPSAAPRSETPTTRKVLAAPAAAADACSEPTKKPKVVSITQPSYTAEAREAAIAGKVRVEVTVDANGRVASARVLEGLGHGLDDAALTAARSATFEPGTRCGRPTSATFVIAIRFAL